MDQLHQNWNIGHVLECLRLIIKIDWVKGAKKFLRFRRVKQVLMSVSDPLNFVNVLNTMINLFLNKGTEKNCSDQMKQEIFSSLDQTHEQNKTYTFMYMMIALYTEVPQDVLMNQLNTGKIDREDLPFFKNDILKIFSLFRDELKRIGYESFDVYDRVTSHFLFLNYNSEESDEFKKSDKQIQEELVGARNRIKKLVE